MDTTEQANGKRTQDRPSQTDLSSLQRLKHIATKGMHYPDALSRVEILEICKLVFCQMITRGNLYANREQERWHAVEAEIERLSQELTLK